MVWGCEPLRSNADGYLGHWLNVCMQMGTEFISIDPQLTWWGARAAYWLPLCPATDLALALAWLNVSTAEDLIDHEFVDCWCAYYDELKEHVAQFTPDWAAEICQVPAEDIAAAARFYAGAERGAIQWGLAFDTQVDSIQQCQTVSNLMSVCGNIDKPGTNILVRNGFEINPGYATAQLYCDPDTFAKKLTVDLVHPGCVQFIGMADCDAVNRAFETGEPYPIKMFWSQGSNGIACSATAAPRVHKMLQNVEFCVVADPYLTPTAVAYADIFLPLKTTAERDSMRVWWTPLRAMKAVSEWYEAKSDEELIVALGNKLNPELFQKRWPTLEALLQDYLDVGFNLYDPETGKSYKSAGRSKAGMVEVEDVHTDFWKKHHADGECSFDALVRKGGYEYDDFCATYRKYEKGLLRADGLPGFQTATGRVELWSTGYQSLGDDPLPYYFPPKLGAEERPDLAREYPLMCTTGARYFASFHSEHRQIPSLRQLTPEPYLEIHPETAAALGIKSGDEVTIENPWGSAHEKAKVTPTVRKDVVAAAHGWWYPEEDGVEPHLFGVWKSNVNSLVPHRVLGKMGFGAPYKQVPVKVYKTPHEECVLG